MQNMFLIIRKEARPEFEHNVLSLQMNYNNGIAANTL